MTNGKLTTGVLVGCVLLSATCVHAQDWPQWRGTNRDAKVTGFKAPKDWPKELKQQWKITVGDGVATPALVGDKLYVFSRQGNNEVVRCLNAKDGMEIWKETYEDPGVKGGGDSGFPGPRSSPAVAEGKVVTLGVNGTLSCFEADSGKKVWRKTDIKGTPRFHVSSSPMIVDGLCIVQMGGDRGPLAAYQLADGKEKWKWSEEGSEYASPVMFTAGDTKMIVAETNKNLVGISLADGKLLWKTALGGGGMRNYIASTPMVQGETVLLSGGGRGTKAFKIEKAGGEFKTKDEWTNSGVSVQFNTPVVKNGLVFGLTSDNKLFCLKADDGKTAWTSSLSGGGGRMGGGGYGSVVDAGPVLFALTPAGDLIVFEPSDKEFKQLAKYKVGTNTYAYPIVSGNRVFVKDKDSVTLWTIG